MVGVAIIPASSEDPGFVLRGAEWDAGLIWAVVANPLLFALLGDAARDLLDPRRRRVPRTRSRDAASREGS